MNVRGIAIDTRVTRGAWSCFPLAVNVTPLVDGRYVGIAVGRWVLSVCWYRQLRGIHS